MSGGAQQMLTIGRALMTNPKVLLLDEPSMGLAPMLVAQIFEIIKQINERGTTVLLVEQNAQQALQLVHRAYVLETGRGRQVRRSRRGAARSRGPRRVSGR
jgi:branched-chain amino acid transport system ATP-binding protein